MALLSDEERKGVWGDAMREMPGTVSLDKPDLRAVVNALDDYLESNAATINASLPLPGRTALTSEQKAYLLSAVALKRFGGV